MTGTLRSTPSLALNRGLAWFLLGFSVLLLALPAAAQTEDPTPDAPARFLIETITVEGVDRPATREIVAKESRIAPGSEVDEEDLRQAIYRVKRLPFVIDADFALRKGSERGRYELVIRIEMASSIFADLSGGAGWERGEPGGGKFDGYGAIGARQFIGSRGYAFGAIDRFRNVQLGYTQFHLFGPGSFLSVGASTSLIDKNDYYNVSLSGGKPLTANQAIGASFGYSRFNSFSTNRSGSVEWQLNTTDDPLLPTRGTAFSTGVNAFSQTDAFRFEGQNLGSTTQGRGLSGLARRYWPLAARHSVWGEVIASQQEIKENFDVGGKFSFSNKNASAGIGYSWDLLRSQVGEPRNDLRFSAFVDADARKAFFDSGFKVREINLNVSLVYRRPQGSISLGFSYRDSFDRRMVQ